VLSNPPPSHSLYFLLMVRTGLIQRTIRPLNLRGTLYAATPRRSLQRLETPRDPCNPPSCARHEQISKARCDTQHSNPWLLPLRAFTTRHFPAQSFRLDRQETDRSYDGDGQSYPPRGCVCWNGKSWNVYDKLQGWRGECMG
jgi:hypothetical protein